MNSCRDLVQASLTAGSGPTKRFDMIVPVLVVPAGRLWQVDYNKDGAVQDPPRPVKRSSLLLNHSWSAANPMVGEVRYRLSHFELVTIDAMDEFFPQWLGAEGFFKGFSS
jgi:hypothetical protein